MRERRGRSAQKGKEGGRCYEGYRAPETRPPSRACAEGWPPADGRVHASVTSLDVWNSQRNLPAALVAVKAVKGRRVAIVVRRAKQRQLRQPCHRRRQLI